MTFPRPRWIWRIEERGRVLPRARLFIAIATVALSLPGAVALAQAPPLESDDPSPATRHAQVIAHGVAPMPGDEIAWRVTVDRAVPPTRADAEERPAGFILADKGVVALVDRDGARLARIAPGEAVWTEPGVERAVIGLERKAPDYYDIALVPATELRRRRLGSDWRRAVPRANRGCLRRRPHPGCAQSRRGGRRLDRAIASAPLGHEWHDLCRIDQQRACRDDDRRSRASCRRRGDHRGQSRARGVRGCAHRTRSACAGRCRSLHVNRNPGFHRHPG